ncbi:flagellar biosynthesis protein FlhA [Leptospira sp. GIMC2001]|uniref:flagellar biosynthesis protein FlhA n=1 Tax=Leptospira sp. GIMC2001 TaxID=1513297 RepID=UPI0004A5C337|nr:flagellar biosynthesis protein FlhA [Leptospira sp. GIMC2001]AID56234.1 flagellar biosynthesis protein FlhA [Leptospira sp. GIMC2001]WCL48270.1 flagellar biosynthesis protein FlhA [Leptospira sp. GIMC2001]
MEKKAWYLNSDFIIGFGALAILAMLIVPLPGFVLDLLLVVSIGVGIIILLTSLSVSEAMDFSIFPTLLLITTLYRLALNVSTTRQILSKGPAVNSQVIEAFGTFVVGGETGLGKYVVGFIIFIIIVIVQIVVITKGATRISEVAARFTLDGLPQKQMAIDMEQNSGAITEQQAAKKRERLQQEVNFYGAMDGASKFVQGDVRAGLVITVINIIGGILIGVSIRGESFVQAIETYGKFTIGDGLVSQIPALLITTATGLIVTRSSSVLSFTEEFRNQLFSNSRILYIVGAALALSALIPGLPFFSLLVLASLFAYLGYYMDKAAKLQVELIEKGEEAKVQDKKPEDYLDEIRTEAIVVSLGLNLLALADVKERGSLLTQIGNTRKKFASDFGLVIPPVRIMDNMEIGHDSYTIKINGIVVGESIIKSDKLMALDNQKQVHEPVEGEKFMEPTYGMEALWIEPSLKSEAETKGYTVVDPSTVIITHLKELIHTHAASLLGREETQALLEHVRKSKPTLIQELGYEKEGRLGIIQQVLQNILLEGLAIRGIAIILESIANNLSKSTDPNYLSEVARQAIARQIVNEYVGADGKLSVIVVEPKLAERLSKNLVDDPLEGKVIAVPTDIRRKLIEAIQEEYKKSVSAGRFTIFTTNRYLRMPLFAFVSRELPPRNFAVLALEEIQDVSNVVVVGQLNLSQAEKQQQEEGAGVGT